MTIIMATEPAFSSMLIQKPDILHTFKLILFCQYKLNFSLLLNLISKGKGKAVPLQAWNGPEGSSKLRFTDFMTTA